MLMPKRVKHRKQFRGSMAGKAMRGNKITNGSYGIVALEPCWICLLYTSCENPFSHMPLMRIYYINNIGKIK